MFPLKQRLVRYIFHPLISTTCYHVSTTSPLQRSAPTRGVFEIHGVYYTIVFHTRLSFRMQWVLPVCVSVVVSTASVQSRVLS